jgi:hypothetical protein
MDQRNFHAYRCDRITLVAERCGSADMITKSVDIEHGV